MIDHLVAGPEPAVEFRPFADPPHVVLRGDIDMQVVQPVGDDEIEQMRTTGPLIVDITEVTFLDSVGVSVLLKLFSVSGSLRLRGGRPGILRLLEACGVQQIFGAPLPD